MSKSNDSTQSYLAYVSSIYASDKETSQKDTGNVAYNSDKVKTIELSKSKVFCK